MRSAAESVFLLPIWDLLNVGIITFDCGVPAIATLNQPVLLALLDRPGTDGDPARCKNVKGGILIGDYRHDAHRHSDGCYDNDRYRQLLQKQCAALPIDVWRDLYVSEGLRLSVCGCFASIPLVLITIFCFQPVGYI